MTECCSWSKLMSFFVGDVIRSSNCPIALEAREHHQRQPSMSAHRRSRSSEDVEESLHRPLVDDDEIEISKSAERVHETKKLFRGQSAPRLESHKPDPIKPPYRHADSWSILRKAIFGLAIYFAVGILVFFLYNKDLLGIKTNSLVDAFYFCAVTLTTVGYGDLVPSSTMGKFLTCLYFLVGFILVSGLVSGAADYLVEKQEAVLVHAIKKKECDDFESKEYNHAEAALYKVYVAGSLFLLVSVIGILFLMGIEGEDFVDALYCVMVTATTLGYGDHAFQTISGRCFAAVWVVTSTVFLAQFLLYVAEYQAVHRQLALAHWVLHRGTTVSDLEAADIDHDGYVSSAEFVIFKLKELGKIDEDDVVEVLKEFKTIDLDHTGRIKVGDMRIEGLTGSRE